MPEVHFVKIVLSGKVLIPAVVGNSSVELHSANAVDESLNIVQWVQFWASWQNSVLSTLFEMPLKCDTRSAAISPASCVASRDCRSRLCRFTAVLSCSGPSEGMDQWCKCMYGRLLVKKCPDFRPFYWTTPKALWTGPILVHGFRRSLRAVCGRIDPMQIYRWKHLVIRHDDLRARFFGPLTILAGAPVFTSASA